MFTKPCGIWYAACPRHYILGAASLKGAYRDAPTVIAYLLAGAI